MRPNPTTHVCPQCGISFTFPASRKQRCCSTPCAVAWRRRDQIDRFWNKVDQSGGPDACWPWKGDLMSAGYGRYSIDGERLGTHRIAYMLTHGDIPADLHILHSCDNRPCCNPAHLRSGTHQDNVADMVSRGRQYHPPRKPPKPRPGTPRGERHGRAKLTEAMVRDIRRLGAGGMLHKKIALRFGVSDTMIAFIVSRKSWAHVD